MYVWDKWIKFDCSGRCDGQNLELFLPNGEGGKNDKENETRDIALSAYKCREMHWLLQNHNHSHSYFFICMQPKNKIPIWIVDTDFLLWVNAYINMTIYKLNAVFE